MSIALIKWYAGYAVAHYLPRPGILRGAGGVLIVLSSIDDLFIDLWYWSRMIYRRVTVERTYKPLTAAQLYQREEHAARDHGARVARSTTWSRR